MKYDELCSCCQNDEVYKNKFFIPLHGMLMEASEEFYYDFYKDKRRQRYLDEQSLNNNDLSYDMLTTDDFNGEDILCSQDMDVNLQLEHKYLLENLRKAILKLTDEEQLLLDRYYYQEMQEKDLSILYGISQQAVSKRISKIRDKLKELLNI